MSPREDAGRLWAWGGGRLLYREKGHSSLVLLVVRGDDQHLVLHIGLNLPNFCLEGVWGGGGGKAEASEGPDSESRPWRKLTANSGRDVPLVFTGFSEPKTRAEKQMSYHLCLWCLLFWGGRRSFKTRFLSVAPAVTHLWLPSSGIKGVHHYCPASFCSFTTKSLVPHSVSEMRSQYVPLVGLKLAV